MPVGCPHQTLLVSNTALFKRYWSGGNGLALIFSVSFMSMTSGWWSYDESRLNDLVESPQGESPVWSLLVISVMQAWSFDVTEITCPMIFPTRPIGRKMCQPLHAFETQCVSLAPQRVNINVEPIARIKTPLIKSRNIGLCSQLRCSSHKHKPWHVRRQTSGWRQWFP